MLGKINLDGYNGNIKPMKISLNSNSNLVDLKTKNLIGFVIYYPFQYYFYKDIYKSLPDEAEFIIDLCHAFDKAEQAELLCDIETLLIKAGVKYRVIYTEDYERKDYLENFFTRYQCLVSTWEKGCMRLSYTQHLKKIRCAYGVGKELTMVRPSGGIYDLVLAHGPRDAKNFSLLAKTEIVGTPKFDDWFSGQVDNISIPEIENKLVNNKKLCCMFQLIVTYRHSTI